MSQPFHPSKVIEDGGMQKSGNLLPHIIGEGRLVYNRFQDFSNPVLNKMVYKLSCFIILWEILLGYSLPFILTKKS